MSSDAPDRATVRYSSTVVAVGPQVAEFLEQGLLILFGDTAPEELHEFCVLHSPEVTDGGIRPGDELRVDDQRFPVLAVGGVADANLVALGHVSLKFNDSTTAELPGDVCLGKGPLTVRSGSTITIVAEATQEERTSA